jgi:DNA primase
MRITAGSFRSSSNHGYLHRTHFQLRGGAIQDLSSQTGLSRASDEHLDRVYRTLLGTFSLSKVHTQSLRKRGLDDAAIESDAYKSSPSAEWKKEIIAKLDHLDLEGVPGFYKHDGNWTIAKIPPGILIPVFNSTRQICGIQIRLDAPVTGAKYIWFSSSKRPYGTSSGAPFHWSKPKILIKMDKLLVTEGALKANVISCFLGVPVVAAAGVSCFGRNFAKSLKANHPNITVVICFDSDWRSKEQVRNALKALR